uniref:Uncharacterized protein n=1 Tax=Cacopsylla melanoneura TaxID=428564 RepID=A0A8D9EAH8_9HEMI
MFELGLDLVEAGSRAPPSALSLGFLFQNPGNFQSKRKLPAFNHLWPKCVSAGTPTLESPDMNRPDTASNLPFLCLHVTLDGLIPTLALSNRSTVMCRTKLFILNCKLQEK